MKIEEAIQRFADYICTERRLAESTTEYYLGDVENFASFLKVHQVEEIEEIDSRLVREFQMFLTEKGEVPGSVIRKIASLRAFFKYLRRVHLLDCDIMAKITLPKRAKKLPIFFRESEVEQIYRDDIYPDTFEGERDKLVLRMLYETGMRRSELTTLTVANVDLAALTIKVLGKRNKQRVIPIQNELAQNIIAYLALRKKVLDEQLALHPERPDTDRLIINGKGRGIRSGNVYQIVETYMPMLSTADRTSPHIFRHTFATHMLNEGANIDAIKELLGHTSLNATEVYTHVTREHLKETYKHAHPRATKK